MTSGANVVNITPVTEASDSELAVAAEINQLSLNGDWAEYKEHWKKLANLAGDDGVVSFAIVDMISKNAPNDEIISLLDEGYTMPKEAIIQADNTILLQRVQKYNVDFSNAKMGGVGLSEFIHQANISEQMQTSLKSFYR